MIFNRTQHKKLWKWISENPEKQGREWEGWENADATDKVNHCFACGYVIRVRGVVDCRYCPLDFGEIINGCRTPCIVFQNICFSVGMNLSEMATKMCNLPIRGEQGRK